MNNEVIEKIRKDSDIVEVISEYIPLEHKGKNYFGVCPFHDDHAPSMSVSPDKQIYKCFSCGASGNVFSFVMDYDHLSFPDAVSKLANRIGINIGTSVKPKVVNRYQTEFEIYQKATLFYQNNLASELGKTAREYLASRKISKNTINEFKIGLSLNKPMMLKEFLLQNKYDEVKLEQLGLTKNGYDLFQDRIMFCYDDLGGNIVGYSARVYQSIDGPKYINSLASPIFNKGMLLLNYQRAKDAARMSGYVVVVEGIIDVIRMYELGINNVVALMGTSISKEQISELKKMATHVYLMLDGDKAGQKATIKATDLAKQVGTDFKVIALPNDDPDTYFLDKIKEDFEFLKEQAFSSVDYKISLLSEMIKEGDVTSVKSFLNHFKSDLKYYQTDSITLKALVNKLSDVTKLDISDIKSLFKAEEEVVVQKPIVKNQEYNKYQKAELMILYYMLQDKQVIEWILDNPVTFITEQHQQLFEEIIIYDDEHDYNIADFITSIQHQPVLNETLHLVLNQHLPDNYNKDIIVDCIKVIIAAHRETKIKELNVLLKKAITTDEKSKIAAQIYKLRMEVENGTFN